MNPKKLRAFAVALPVTAAVAIGAVRIVADYQAEAGFHPFDSKREMQTNQVLFPDQETASGADSQEQDSADSFWQQDDSNSGGAAGAGSGYLFTPEQTLSPGASTTGTLAQDGTAPTPGSLTADVVYDLVDDAGNADLLLPTGGQTIGEPEGDGGQQDETGSGQTPGNEKDPEQPGKDQPGSSTKPGEIVVDPEPAAAPLCPPPPLRSPPPAMATPPSTRRTTRTTPPSPPR